jgi:hypothetical protein
MALLLRPIVELPPIAAGLTWFYLKVAMALLAIVWAFRLVETRAQPFPLGGKVLAVLLTLRPILGDLTHGNVNLFILFLVMAALYAYHRGYDVLSGIILALAIACKVTPALFLIYFVWKRAWGVLIGGFAGLLLFLFLIPGTFLGHERNVELLTSWYDCMVKPFVVSSEVTSEHLNQSLPGLVYRWFTESPSTIKDGVPIEFHTRVVLDPFWVKAIIKGCMAAFALLVVWTCRTATQPRGGWRLAAEFSLVFVGMLMFSERTWKHHCVTLLLPFAVLAYHVTMPATAKWMRVYLAASVSAATLLMVTTGSGISERWDRFAKSAHADGAYVWAYLVLIAALAVLLRSQTSAACSRSDRRQHTMQFAADENG